MGWLIAIDVGSSSTAAAVVTPGDAPRLLRFGESPVLPSGVLLGDAGALVVGADAERSVGASPDRYERSPKRRLGDRVMLLGGQPVEPVDAIAAVLTAVLDTAIATIGEPPEAVRMTVPARWGGVRTGLLADAAVRAGLPEPVLVPEPVAAALYAAETDLPVGAHVAVYDLGGGTSDTAVLSRTATGFEVIGAPGGNDQLGGELFDDLVLDHLGARIGEVSPDAWEQIRYSSERPWRQLGHELRVQARRAKEALSTSTEYDLYLGAPLDMEGRVTRDELETLLRPALKESVAELLATIRRAGLGPGDLSRVYVVGGATRTPLVLRLIAEELGTMPMTWGDPKAAVVLGAASSAARSHLHAGSAPRSPVPAAAPEPAGLPEPDAATDLPEQVASAASIGPIAPIGPIEPIAPIAPVGASAPATTADLADAITGELHPPDADAPAPPDDTPTGRSTASTSNPVAIAITLACATAAVLLIVFLVVAILS
ncbi:MAG: Hsp70 family protein [Microthrixaceae bacterium]